MDPDELEELGKLDERERVLVILDIFRDSLGDLWSVLHNRVVAGDDYDPRRADFEDDRLMP